MSRSPARAPREALLSGVDPRAVLALRRGEHHDPHALLGAHPARVSGREGCVVRAFHPDAVAAELLLEGAAPLPLLELGGGLFGAFLAGAAAPSGYRLRFRFAGGRSWERGDPYRFLPIPGELDLHLIGEGTHRRLWQVLGAHPRRVEGEDGTAFAVWAPNAVRVSVVGDFCGWDGRLLPMRSLGSTGVFELFVPGVGAGALYKYEIRTREGALRLKTDPMAQSLELPPATASRVARSDFEWTDADWLAARARRDPTREPLSIYEVHLGSFARVPEEGDRFLSYRELAPRLVRQAQRFGFSHVELMPLAEHAFYASWGYQVTGYYAPTGRYGSPDDLRFLIDTCHRSGIGVILDWVPAHFPRDDFALRRFDGTALYEHEDPRLGEHPDWGTLIFNYGRAEVRNFLVANALYWLQEFHVDALRIDAVASMLYLDYSREEGAWLPNPHGGRENLEAIGFLREANRAVREEVPGAFTVAEESTAWPGVTRPVEHGGLGFTFKWNMGWMHDTLVFAARNSVYRGFHLDELSFSMLYEYSERFLNPLSHDEVVHGKGSLLSKLPGDFWQKLANLRLLLAYQFTRPGKPLLFMGTELAPEGEWRHDWSLDWHLEADPMRQGLARFLEDLGRLYRECSPLWRRDHDPDGFEWIDCSDRQHAVMAYARRDGGAHALVVLNWTPVPRPDYRLGAPEEGVYRLRLSSDASRYGGSGSEVALRVASEPVPWHGRKQSLRLQLPPLSALVLEPEG
jgi:1,4-alpha-glucan branching enzyme